MSQLSAAKNLAMKKSWRCFGGMVQKWTHESAATKTSMTFSIFLPPNADKVKSPALYWLSGLTCTDDNFTHKAGAFKAASEHGLVLIMPDTSPRGVSIEGDNASWDFGVGAGFYVNATEPKWAANYNMYDYVVNELPSLVRANFPVNEKKSVFGHSMGGHGALIAFLKNPGAYESVSAFAPISHPSACPWGVKAFTGYLGADQSKWKEYDATALIEQYAGPKPEILIDQGQDDEFYQQKQLLPEDLISAAKKNNFPVNVRFQPGYDHSYFFISTFVDDHIKHHAKFLNKKTADEAKGN